MKRYIWIIVVVISLLASSCGSTATPTTDAADVQKTAVAAAFTVVAQTLAAVPTETPLPPTEAPTLTPLPTETPLPSPTLDLLAASPTGIPTFTLEAPTSSSASDGGGDPCNKPLTTWAGPTAKLTVTNETKPKGKITLSLWVSTDLGECGYLNVYSDSLNGPVGQYSAGAFVDGKKSFKVFGGFRITGGSWRVIVRNDYIFAQGVCYPNC